MTDDYFSGDGPAASCFWRISVSSSPVHLATTTAATPLPMTLVMARASDIKAVDPEVVLEAGDENDEAASGDAGGTY